MIFNWLIDWIFETKMIFMKLLGNIKMWRNVQIVYDKHENELTWQIFETNGTNFDPGVE